MSKDGELDRGKITKEMRRGILTGRMNDVCRKKGLDF